MKRCTICNDPLSSTNKSGLCMWHRVRRNRCVCQDCGHAFVHKNARKTCEACSRKRYPFLTVPADRMGDYRTLRDYGFAPADAAAYVVTGAPLPSPPPSRRIPAITAREAIDAVAALTDIPADQITGARQTRPVMVARSAVAFVLRREGMSFTAIGRRLGNRDHTTVINMVRRWPVLAAAHPSLAREAEKLGRSA